MILQFYKTSQVSKMLGVSEYAITKMRKTGKISYYKFSRKTIRFSEDEVLRIAPLITGVKDAFYQ